MNNIWGNGCWSGAQPEWLAELYKNCNLDWIAKNTIYLTIHGSKAYGTNTPLSDTDLRGICIPSKKYYLGTLDHFEQYQSMEPYDLTVFDIRKFVKLAMDANPNALEIIFTDYGDHIFTAPIFEKINNIREKFLSTKCKYSMSGYAQSQLRRMQTHRQWIISPIINKPERKDFGLPEDKNLIPHHQLLEIDAAINKKISDWHLDTTGIDSNIAIEIKNKVYDIMHELKINSEEFDLYAARYLGLGDNLMEAFKKERQYKQAKRNHENYLSWKKNRNPERAVLEEKFGMDCYDEETEFLTVDGWKNFDDISKKDFLATVNTESLTVEFQKYSDKIDKQFTGQLYNIIGYHVNIMVTPNHNILNKKVSRKARGPIADCNRGILEFTKAAELPADFDILTYITPNEISNFDFSNLSIDKEDYLKLIGWYLSDGCTTKTTSKRKIKNNKSINSINISQKQFGKLYYEMVLFNKKYSKTTSLYKYKKIKNRNTPVTECVLSVRNSDVVNKIYDDCGNLKNKRLPRWVFSLSKNEMEIVFDALMGGDGTYSRPDNSMIYYSSLNGLADDVHELAFYCGFETSKYGPYFSTTGFNPSIMYQIHINKTRTQFRTLRRNSIKKIDVNNKRVVCFTVPNSTLVTRYKGNIAIQGNCKHAAQLYRLYVTCIDLLTTGKLIVKRPDAEQILAIKNGAWSFEQLTDWAKEQEEKLNILYANCTVLPREPDRQTINNVCIEIIESFL